MAKRLLISALMAALTVVALPAVAAEHAAQPPTSLLRSGDLIWPRQLYAIVPYSSEAGEALETHRDLWIRQKNDFLVGLESLEAPSDLQKAQHELFEQMTYAEFQSKYLADDDPEPTLYGIGYPYVGHVGVIQIEDSLPYVIEAVLGKGVRRVTYTEWLKEREGALIWLGRIEEIAVEQASVVAATAAAQIGKPYDFWNFDLSDVSGFYCSKLIWYSMVKALGVAPDDNLDHRRVIWYSPKQLMKSSRVRLIFQPENY